MHNRFLFRDRGQVIRTRRGPGLGDVVFTVAAVAVLVLMLAWAHSTDQRDDAQRAFEAGLVTGRDEMAETVGDAYRRGRLDALAELAHQAGQPAADAGAPCPLPAAPVVRQRGGLL